MENNFNFGNFLENQNQINSQLVSSSQNMSQAIMTLKEQTLDVISQQVNDLVVKFSKLENDVSIIKKDNEESKEAFRHVTQDIEGIKEITNVLNSDRAKARELSKSVRARAFKFSGSKTSPKYELFYRYFTSRCYGHLKEIFNVESYRDIKIDDFEMALKAVSNWHPTQASINKKLHEYIDLQDKGLLPKVRSNALDLYLEEINGGAA